MAFCPFGTVCCIAFGNFVFVFWAFLRHLRGIRGLFSYYRRITRGTRPRYWRVLWFPFIFDVGLEKGFGFGVWFGMWFGFGLDCGNEGCVMEKF
jgi:hypothetical protein